MMATPFQTLEALVKEGEGFWGSAHRRSGGGIFWASFLLFLAFVGGEVLVQFILVQFCYDVWVCCACLKLAHRADQWSKPVQYLGVGVVLGRKKLCFQSREDVGDVGGGSRELSWWELDSPFQRKDD